MKALHWLGSLAIVLGGLTAVAAASVTAASTDWPTSYDGDPAASHYSRLDQINTNIVRGCASRGHTKAVADSERATPVPTWRAIR